MCTCETVQMLYSDYSESLIATVHTYLDAFSVGAQVLLQQLCDYLYYSASM